MSRSNSPKRRRRGKSKPRPTCTPSGGKLRYGTRKRALGAMNATRARVAEGARKRPVAVYRCASCGGWHMTSKAQS